MRDSVSPPKKRRRFGWVVLGLLLAIVLVGFWLYREATAVPDFYAEALTAPKTTIPPKVAADRVEREVLNVQNRLERAEPWQLVLKDEEMNAWLATDLPQKMPQALPKEIENPRVAIRDGAIHIACKHQKLMGGVLSLVLLPALTDKPNELAVTVQSFCVGRLPLPQKQYLDEVSKAAAKSGLNLHWEERNGSAVALVLLPDQYENLKDRTVHIESVQVGEGELLIQGKAERTKKP
jgi:hypothetical protein